MHEGFVIPVKSNVEYLNLSKDWLNINFFCFGSWIINDFENTTSQVLTFTKDETMKLLVTMK